LTLTHHSGIALLAPQVLHHGMAEQVIEQRQLMLDQAYARNPEHFVRASTTSPQTNRRLDQPACTDGAI
jgi:hypothetical protein